MSQHRFVAWIARLTPDGLHHLKNPLARGLIGILVARLRLTQIRKIRFQLGVDVLDRRIARQQLGPGLLLLFQESKLRDEFFRRRRQWLAHDEFLRLRASST